MAADKDQKPTPFALRDLIWVISSPFLLKQTPRPDLARHPETAALLAKLAKDPTPLIDHVTPLVRRSLGHYFEQLVSFWLGNLPSVALIGTNVRIYREKQSVGELDLLFTQGGTAYHWELAVKFYLNIGSGENERDYVGPMLRDNLQKKLDRLYGHQLRLPEMPETRATLQQLGIGPLVSSPWVKGRLFQPLGKPAGHLPNRVLPDCLTGNWISLGDLAAARLPSFDHFLFPGRSRWLTPDYYEQEAETGGRPALMQKAGDRLGQQPVPVLACLMTDAGGDALKETGRLFIAPDGWPALARKPDNGEKLGDGEKGV